MRTLACFLEEPSARAFLEGVLPRILPEDVEVRYVVFQGKQDLEKQIERKLRCWKKPDTLFLVMRDQDAAICTKVKEKLAHLCMAAGKPDTLVRIACHELESFYIGDLSATGKALGLNGLATLSGKAGYRNPDKIQHPSRELDRLTRGIYQKIGSSREIGKIISIEGNASQSFNVLISGIRRICGIA
ncbi:MAG: DUF4276 family protein [Fusobacteriaceae bacterium]|jgi:hypothetical protein|nr:DUF4276 family protein [Fusobacteriaceae bacterium]